MAAKRGFKWKNDESVTCKHCKVNLGSITLSALGNHSRWCALNPMLAENKKVIAATGRREGLMPMDPEIVRKRTELVKQAHKDGRYANSFKKMIVSKIAKGNLGHSEEAKETIRAAALASKHQRVCKSTHDFVDKKGRTFRFDSKWEDAMAMRLDELDVEWDRPEPLEYEMDGKKKHYFPDFHLPAFGLYLDPKNSWCRTIQARKIEIIGKMVNLVILGSLAECQSFVPSR